MTRFIPLIIIVNLCVIILFGCNREKGDSDKSSGVPQKTLQTESELLQIEEIVSDLIQPLGGLKWEDNLVDVVIKLNKVGVKNITFRGDDLSGCSNKFCVLNKLKKTTVYVSREPTVTVQLNNNKYEVAYHDDNVSFLEFWPAMIGGVPYKGIVTFNQNLHRCLAFLSKNPDKIFILPMKEKEIVYAHRIWSLELSPLIKLDNNQKDSVKSLLKIKYPNLLKNRATDKYGNFITINDTDMHIKFELSSYKAKDEYQLSEDLLYPKTKLHKTPPEGVEKR